MVFDHAKWQREWRKKNPDKCKAYKLKDKALHGDIRRAQDRARYHKNSEKYRIYRENNKELLKERSKKSTMKKHDKYLIHKREFYQLNKYKWNEYMKNRRHNDPAFKLVNNLRHRVYIDLKQKKTLQKTIIIKII